MEARMSSKSMIIAGGRVIDPAQNIDRLADVLISDGRIVDVTDHVHGRAAGRV